VIENMVLRIIIGHKREQIAEGWRRLHGEELVRFTKCYLGLQIQTEMGGACNTHWTDKKYIQNFGWETCREKTQA
jgi:hypothetical protein